MSIKSYLKKKIKSKLDVNKDGKVNGKDFVAAIKNHIDSNHDGDISIEEITVAVGEAYTTASQLKKLR